MAPCPKPLDLHLESMIFMVRGKNILNFKNFTMIFDKECWDLKMDPHPPLGF